MTILTVDDLVNLHQPPIILQDGSLGLVITWDDARAGVQVPGENDIRWIPFTRIENLGQGALVETLEAR